MLYPTLPPSFFFHFNPSSSSSSSASPSPSPPLPSFSFPPVQAQGEMECVERALKSSLRPAIVAKTTPQQGFLDDFWAPTGQTGAASVDEFFVDDLLDFSNGGVADGSLKEEPEEEEEDEQGVHRGCASLSPKQEPTEDCHNYSKLSTSFALKDEFGSLPAGELSVPADDLADLEWLSHFVEDSFSEYSLTYPAGNLPEKPRNHREKRPEPEAPKPCFATPVPAKARSKRVRTGGRVWSLGSPSGTDSSSTSSSSSMSSSPPNPWLVYGTQTNSESFNSELKPPTKRQKRRPANESVGATQPPRRCSHCLVQKTPQWRTGPLGAKTLCNACGVRYKSGRLLPEYRPACSPTFSSDLHSNNHRKVLEMRRNKEISGPESGLAPAVQSF
ncbi:GATA transcription factor 5 [Malania oleifera]|uniref:GATA transcription factor 5 n=1 Tax=Malania oleifera TaxID=397392 RepID=UPI0025AEAF75|nr:GATA transcription factor 5 [Malania oleifera]